MEMNLETMPSNLPAERAILGALILDNGLIDEALFEMQQSDFASRSHRVIFAAMRWLVQQKRAITPITLRDALEKAGKLDEIGGPAYLTELFDGAMWLKNLKSHRDLVQNCALARQMVYFGNWVTESAMARDCQPRELLRVASERLMGLVESQPCDDLISSAAAVDQTMAELKENWRAGRDVIGLRTGFAAIDQTLGGIRNGKYYVIAGGPGFGKSTLAFQMARNFLDPRIQGDDIKRAGLGISLEMSAKELTLKALSAETGLAAAAIEHGRMNSEELDRLEEAAARLQGLSLDYLEGFHKVTGRSIEARVAKVRRKYGAVHFLVLDHVQLADGEKEYETANARITEISRLMKRTAHRYNIPVILLSQMNRENTKRSGSARDYQLPDLRDSSSIAQDADVVMFIMPEDWNAPHSARRRLVIEKNRTGRAGETFDLILEGEISRFESAAEHHNKHKSAWKGEWNTDDVDTN